MNKYIVPKMEYWIDNELDSIEARMSGGGGSVAGFCYIDGSYINTTYDGENLTIEYKVKNKPPQVGNGIELIVGFEYALSALEGKQVFIPLNTEPGTYEEVFEVPNYMCAFRGYVQERIGIQGMGAVTNKNPGETLYPFPIETITQFSTITLSEKIWEIVVEVGIGLATYKIKIAVGVIATIGATLDIAGLITSIVELTPIQLPPDNLGAYYRYDTTYSNNEVTTLIRAWLSKENYDSWKGRIENDEIVSPAEEPAFTCEISKDLPDFAN